MTCVAHRRAIASMKNVAGPQGFLENLIMVLRVLRAIAALSCRCRRGARAASSRCALRLARQHFLKWDAVFLSALV
jgi:hypothetical protein